MNASSLNYGVFAQRQTFQTKKGVVPPLQCKDAATPLVTIVAEIIPTVVERSPHPTYDRDRYT